MEVTLARWLTETARVGDLVLTGDSGKAGRFIQKVTNSNYSHAAVVVTATTLIEAYDYALTPDETDEGVYEISFEEFANRDGITRAALLRPSLIDLTLLELAANRFLANSPTFASIGAALQALAHLATRRVDLQQLVARETSEILDEVLTFQATLIGDGTKTVQCAELATRLYCESGVPLVFEAPFLAPLLAHVGAETTVRNNGDIHIAGPIRGTRDTSNSRTAETSSWSIETLANSLRSIRSRFVDIDPPDMADFIVPGDYMRASPFTFVGEIRQGRSLWQLSERPSS